MLKWVFPWTNGSAAYKKRPKNKFPSVLQLSALKVDRFIFIPEEVHILPPNKPHAPPSDLHVLVFPPQTAPTIPSVQPFSSFAAYIAPQAPIYVLPRNSDWPPPLLPSNLYVMPPTNPSDHPDVKNPQIHSTFELVNLRQIPTLTCKLPRE